MIKMRKTKMLYRFVGFVLLLVLLSGCGKANSTTAESTSESTPEGSYEYDDESVAVVEEDLDEEDGKVSYKEESAYDEFEDYDEGESYSSSIDSLMNGFEWGESEAKYEANRVRLEKEGCDVFGFSPEEIRAYNSNDDSGGLNYISYAFTWYEEERVALGVHPPEEFVNALTDEFGECAEEGNAYYQWYYEDCSIYLNYFYHDDEEIPEESYLHLELTIENTAI